MRGLQEGFDWLSFIRRPTLVAVLVLSPFAAIAGVQDGPDGGGLVTVMGQLFDGAEAVTGEISVDDVSLTATCTESACRTTCEASLPSPFCSIVNATCETDGGCRCIYFCVVQGGRQHTPGEKWDYPGMATSDPDDSTCAAQLR